VTVFIIATLLERSVPSGLRIQLAGGSGRCLATVRLCKSIGAILDKLENASRIALNKSPVKGRESVLIRSMYTGSPSQEKVHALREALVCRPHECSVAIAVYHINGDALMQQQCEEENIAVECGNVKGVVSLCVGDERVAAVIEEKIDCVVVAALSRPL